MQGIVTGASRGLGLALTRALSQRGWSLVVDARDADALARAVGDLDCVTAIAGDVADPDHRRALVEAAGGTIDLLVNNASVLGPTPLPVLRDYDLEALRQVYEVNVIAPLVTNDQGVLRQSTYYPYAWALRYARGRVLDLRGCRPPGGGAGPLALTLLLRLP